MKKIVLITSGQPSTNPRLVKEADALFDDGYNVTVLYTYWNRWATEHDTDLLGKRKWRAIRVGGDPLKDKQRYFFSKIRHRVAIKLAQTLSLKLSEIAIARGSFALIQEAQKHRADLYIAHNLGALPAAVKAAHRYNKPCGFDAEDFHRNEATDDTAAFNYKLKKHIEDKYIPHLSYLTASSPLIAEAYQKLYPAQAPVVILNVFNRSAALNQWNKSSKIKLFWFSQTIGPQRGLEQLTQALTELDNQAFELHLLGEVNVEFKQRLSEIYKDIVFYPPISADAIPNFAAQFDIGIASELRAPLNKDICLANKLFTYLQSGLAVLASNTQAQQKFIDAHPRIGLTYKFDDIASIKTALLHFLRDNDALLQAKEAASRLGQTEMNWDNEKQKFLSVIKSVLANAT